MAEIVATVLVTHVVVAVWGAVLLFAYRRLFGVNSRYVPSHNLYVFSRGQIAVIPYGLKRVRRVRWLP